ncbi:MAG TPA: hypothetical protein VK572_12795 [Burkholderiales bacterium]|nr:hypothetical protein [Burkholderiales bacterium]
MRYKFTVEPAYLKVDLFDQHTAEETQQVLAAVAAEARKHGRSQILISAHASRPIFRVSQHGLPDYFKELGEVSRCRVALTGDSPELRLSQEYIESLAQRHGVNLRSFRSEQAALQWFKDRRWADRRERQEAWDGKDRRQQWRRSLVGTHPDDSGDVHA